MFLFAGTAVRPEHSAGAGARQSGFLDWEAVKSRSGRREEPEAREFKDGQGLPAGERPRAATSRRGESASPVSGRGPEQEAGELCGEGAGGVLARVVEMEGTPVWVLLSAPATPVRLNGNDLLLGLSVLRDRDEIVVGTATGNVRFYFCGECLAETEPAPPGLRLRCARCKSDIVEGSLAVRCPACGAWHHQRDDRPCWTYAQRCGGCHRQETSLGGEPEWSPAQL